MSIGHLKAAGNEEVDISKAVVCGSSLPVCMLVRYRGCGIRCSFGWSCMQTDFLFV